MGFKDAENAKIALKHRLYSNPTYQLIDALREIAETGKGKCHLYYHNGIPVGTSVRQPNDMVQVFVRKSMRGRGIGSLLVLAQGKDGSWGSSESISQGKIFKYNGIKVY